MAKNKTAKAKEPIIKEVDDAAKEEAEKPETVEEVAEPEKPEALPQFKNNGKDMKIKLIEGEEFKWITVKHGEVVTIPKKIALANELEEVE